MKLNYSYISRIFYLVKFKIWVHFWYILFLSHQTRGSWLFFKIYQQKAAPMKESFVFYSLEKKFQYIIHFWFSVCLIILRDQSLICQQLSNIGTDWYFFRVSKIWSEKKFWISDIRKSLWFIKKWLHQFENS